MYETVIHAIILALLTTLIANGAPVINVPKVSKLVRLDGKLTDDVWQRSPDIAKFYLIGLREAGTKEYKTEVWFAHTNKALYAAVRCEEPNLEKMILRADKHDDPVWNDDSIEFFFDPSGTRKSFVQIAVNARGTVGDLLYAGAGIREELSWNSGIRTAVSQEKGSWTLEVEIPFAGLPVTRPAGDWAFNIGRNRIASGEWYCCIKGVKSYHEVENFGILRGINIPDFQIGMHSCDFGERKIGLNRARIVVKNWSKEPRQAFVEFCDGTGTMDQTDVAVGPGNTEIVEIPFWITPGKKGKSISLLVKSVEGRSSITAIPAPKNDSCFEFIGCSGKFAVKNQVISIPVQLQMTENTLKQVKIDWTLCNAAGRKCAEGTVFPVGDTAKINLMPQNTLIGLNTLKLVLSANGKNIETAIRQLCIENSPF